MPVLQDHYRATPSSFSTGDAIYELGVPCANTTHAYLVLDKEAVQYEMMLAGQTSGS